MTTVSGMAGSLQRTSWKRRSRAASFSKYFLYSAQVVAAMVRSSPRARAGLSRLEASPPPAARAGADHHVGLVDEGDHRLGAFLDLADDVLEAVLELALDARAGLQQPQVERDEPHAAEEGRHVALDDAQGEALDDRGFAGARLADDDRVVLAAAAEDVDHLADLGVAAEDRVDLAGLGLGGQVHGELLDGGAAAGRRRRPAARASRAAAWAAGPSTISWKWSRS